MQGEHCKWIIIWLNYDEFLQNKESVHMYITASYPCQRPNRTMPFPVYFLCSLNPDVQHRKIVSTDRVNSQDNFLSFSELKIV